MRKISEDLAARSHIENMLPSSTVRKAALNAARAAKEKLFLSIENGVRGEAERALQIEALLDYQEALYAVDLLVGEAQ